MQLQHLYCSYLWELSNTCSIFISSSKLLFVHHLPPERTTVAMAWCSYQGNQPMPLQVCEADAGRRLQVDAPVLSCTGSAASQIDRVAPAPLGLWRLELNPAEHRVPQQPSAPQLHTTRQRLGPVVCARCGCLCVRGRGKGSNLNGDVCAGVSPVEDGSEVELGVSVRLENPRPYGVILTAHYGINIWSCGSWHVHW